MNLETSYHIINLALSLQIQRSHHVENCRKVMCNRVLQFMKLMITEFVLGYPVLKWSAGGSTTEIELPLYGNTGICVRSYICKWMWRCSIAALYCRQEISIGNRRTLFFYSRKPCRVQTNTWIPLSSIIAVQQYHCSDFVQTWSTDGRLRPSRDRFGDLQRYFHFNIIFHSLTPLYRKLQINKIIRTWRAVNSQNGRQISIWLGTWRPKTSWRVQCYCKPGVYNWTSAFVSRNSENRTLRF